MNDDSRLLVSVEEAARRLSLGQTVLYEKLAAGEIASIKDGRRRLIPVRALQAYVDAKLAEATA